MKMSNVVELNPKPVGYRDYNESPLVTVMMLLESCDGAIESDMTNDDKLSAISLMTGAAHYITQFLWSNEKPDNYYEIVDAGLSVAIGAPVKNGLGKIPEVVTLVQADDYMGFVMDMLANADESTILLGEDDPSSKH
jgi:hypothetical protein